MQYIFATHNQHKLDEIKMMTPPSIQILSLTDLNDSQDIEETGSTFAENAQLKAQQIYTRYNKPTFADDSGLEVEELQNAPGVYSKRFAGAHATDAENREKLLHLMQQHTHRHARFVTVIALIYSHKVYFFEGEIKGRILQQEIGKNGFGYDSIFQPLGYDISMAQMTMIEKNKISHRHQALQKMIAYITTHV